MINNQPNKIYLQIDLEDNGETCEDFNELSDISWCADKIYSDDLEYISVSIVLARIKELEAEIDNDESEYSITSLRMMIKALKELL